MDNSFRVQTRFIEYKDTTCWVIMKPQLLKICKKLESEVSRFKNVPNGLPYKLILIYADNGITLNIQYINQNICNGCVVLNCCLLNHEQEVIYRSKSSLKESVSIDKIFFRYDMVTLQCDVKFTVSCGEIIQAPLNTTHTIEMKKHLSGLFLDNENCDVKFYVGNVIYPAHKFIIAAHSPVFKRMFLNGMKEQQENKVYIKNSTAEVFFSMLHYMYVGTVIDLKEYVNELIILAEMYEVKLLVHKCVHCFLTNMNEENVLDSIVLAFKLNIDNLMQACLECISINRKRICYKREFENIKQYHPDLAIKILDWLS